MTWKKRNDVLMWWERGDSITSSHHLITWHIAHSCIRFIWFLSEKLGRKRVIPLHPSVMCFDDSSLSSISSRRVRSGSSCHQEKGEDKRITHRQFLYYSKEKKGRSLDFSFLFFCLISLSPSIVTKEKREENDDIFSSTLHSIKASWKRQY